MEEMCSQYVAVCFILVSAANCFFGQMLVKGLKEMEKAGHENKILGMVVCLRGIPL
jgi:hypothetical protein